MCANFKPASPGQIQLLNLPDIPFEYVEEVYPGYELPLLFRSSAGLEWRKVQFGLVPKWAEDKTIGNQTYNARNETLLQKPSFAESLLKHNFGVIPVMEFYEYRYISNKPQRWAVRRKDGQAFYIAALYEITRIGEDIIRSATMISMDANNHAMMKDFHEPGTDKRSVVVIPTEQLEEWLEWKSTDISRFIQGFPEDEFECMHVPKAKIEKASPQLSFFDFMRDN